RPALRRRAGLHQFHELAAGGDLPEVVQRLIVGGELVIGTGHEPEHRLRRRHAVGGQQSRNDQEQQERNTDADGAHSASIKQGFGVRGSRFSVLGSRFCVLGCRFWVLGFAVLGSVAEPRTKNPEPRTPNPEPRTRVRRTRTMLLIEAVMTKRMTQICCCLMCCGVAASAQSLKYPQPRKSDV